MPLVKLVVIEYYPYMDPAQLVDLDFFNGLSLSELNSISPYFTYQTFQSGEEIFRQNELANFFYIVCEGLIEIVFKPEDGPQMRVSIINPGGIFGWSAAMGNDLYTSGARCIEDSKTLKLRGKDLYEITNKYPNIGVTLTDRLQAAISARCQDQKINLNGLLLQNAFQFDLRNRK